MGNFIFQSLLAVMVCSLCLRLFYPLATKIGLVDRPSELKRHCSEVPLVGGIAIFCGFLCTLLYVHFAFKPLGSLIVGSLALVLLGLIDDFYNLNAKLRLIVQLLIVTVSVLSGSVVLTTLGDLFSQGTVYSGVWAVPLSVFVIVSYINAFNMIDGQDGLAGLIALGQVVWLLIYAVELGSVSYQYLLCSMLMLLLLFLFFNISQPWRKNIKIFLGDAGSLFISFVLASIGIVLSQTNTVVLKPMSVLWLMSLPIFDLFGVVLYRLQQKKPVFSAGRHHVHHLLQAYQVKDIHSTCLLGAASFFLGTVGFILNKFSHSESLSFLLYVAFFLAYLLLLFVFRATLAKKIAADV